jgi:hypothetical protein
MNTLRRSNVTGLVAVMCAGTSCVVALITVCACIVIATRGGSITAEQINVLGIAIGVTGTFFGFAGALLAVPQSHGRTTDPTNAAHVTTLTTTEVDP